MLIDSNTLSTIQRLDDGRAVLRFYRGKVIVFEKTYPTWTGAKIAETKLIKKYY